MKNKKNLIMKSISDLPMWTEIHIQPLDIDNLERSKVIWIKHPQLEKTFYGKELQEPLTEFLEYWNK